MAFAVVQADTKLYAFNSAGGNTVLTLPTNVTLSNQLVPRFTRFGRYVVLVNSPSKPLSIDTVGTVRPLTPNAPTAPLTLSAGAAGGLNGAYLAKQTYVILDVLGNIISESDFGPLPSTSQQVTAQKLRITNIPLSAETITATRLYRTTAGPGAVYFKWLDVSGNTNTATEDDTPDAALNLIAAGALGTAPDLTLCVEWQGRLWGVARNDIDNLRYTEAGTMYAWSALNTLPIPHVGDDRYGVVGLAPRRNSLGVGRQNRLMQVVGDTRDNIRPIGITENCGFLSQESIRVYRDAVFFLWRDGIYQWDGDGVECISDDAGVRTWFTTNSYFNQGMFSQAFAEFDPVNLSYRLFLCSAGSTITDSWIEYSLKTGKFYGPHQTLAFTPTCAFAVRGTNDKLFPMVGSREGYISQDSDDRSDWGLTPIDMRITTAPYYTENQDYEKFFGQLSVHTTKEPAGSLNITAKVGRLGEEFTDTAMVHDLTHSRERLNRIGQGTEMSIVFENNQLSQNCTIFGYEIDPVSIIGKR